MGHHGTIVAVLRASVLHDAALVQRTVIAHVTFPFPLFRLMGQMVSYQAVPAVGIKTTPELAREYALKRTK